MNIITREHDFNLPIRFTFAGYIAFVNDHGLTLTEQVQRDCKARFVDAVENRYVFDLDPDNANNDLVFATFNPKESRVIARTSQF
jgi:hypothetical protein